MFGNVPFELEKETFWQCLLAPVGNLSLEENRDYLSPQYRHRLIKVAFFVPYQKHEIDPGRIRMGKSDRAAKAPHLFFHNR
jgi:hypothetical protein